MNANFWNTQNIIILSVAMLAIPTGAAAGLYLLKKSNVDETVDVVVTRKVEAPKKATIVETAPAEPVKVEEKVVTKIPAPRREDPQAQRLLDRIGDATSQSELVEHADDFKKCLENAEVVERLHCVTFNGGKQSLDNRDEHYLVTALRSNPAFQKHAENPNAVIAVFGYASKDGDSRNNRYALTRARSTQSTIREHEAELGYNGVVKSWCVGETAALSDEIKSRCNGFDRAAEVWLIVDGDRGLNSVKSDNFIKAGHIKKSSCSSHR